MPPLTQISGSAKSIEQQEFKSDELRFGRFEQLLNLQEAALILEVHWKTLEGMARNGEVPAFKVGKRWRFRLSSLNIWLEHGLNSNTTNHAALTGQEQNP
jgi:excisionase family DNA binding protein